VYLQKQCQQYQNCNKGRKLFKASGLIRTFTASCLPSSELSAMKLHGSMRLLVML